MNILLFLYTLFYYFLTHNFTYYCKINVLYLPLIKTDESCLDNILLFEFTSSWLYVFISNISNLRLMTACSLDNSFITTGISFCSLFVDVEFLLSQLFCISVVSVSRVSSLFAISFCCFTIVSSTIDSEESVLLVLLLELFSFSSDFSFSLKMFLSSISSLITSSLNDF